MKRYKDCALICNENQQSFELLDIVIQVSEANGYKINKYPVMENKVSVSVYMREEGLPYSRLIVSNMDDEVAVVNIVPMRESGISHIDYTEYNRLLDIFRDKVFKVINKQNGNRIRENSEDYEIVDVIPLSFSKLNEWLSFFPLSGHLFDEKRWYAFIVSLHVNHEHLSLDDFEKYIQEKYGWDKEVVEEFSLKLESQLELLEYYDAHR